MHKAGLDRTPTSLDRLVFISRLIIIAVSSATGIVYVIHEFFRPELQSYLTALSFAVSLIVSTPICTIVGNMYFDLQKVRIDLEDAKRAAESASLAKSDFLAHMSHEIRTPMNGVLGMAEVLSRTPLDDRQKSFVDTINRSGRGLMGIIDDILDFSKIEAGMLTLDPAPFDLEEEVRDIARLFGARAAEKKIDLLFRYEPGIPSVVSGDAGRIRQIITNLVGNAVKFTDAGRIVIRVRGAAEGGVLKAVIAIEDTGIGISADKLGLIFDEFAQAESSTTRNYGGTGLGLAISRRLAAAMGGALEVASREGEGSTFTLRIDLPTANIEASTASANSSVDRAPTPGGVASSALLSAPTVLVAEDNEVNQMVIRSMIEGEYALTFAANGEQAVSLFENNNFDIVLMDVSMPVMDGHQAAAAIRAFERKAARTRTPIICLTAHASSDASAACSANGMDDYVTKPLKRDLLLAMLKKWSGRPAPAAESAA